MGSLNWGDLVKDAGESGTFGVLPDGDYDLKVIESSHALSGGGKQMYKITAEVVSGPYAKRRVWDNLVISPDSSAALGFFFRKMKALGLGQEYFQTNPTNDQIVSALKNRPFRGTLGKKTYNGTESNEIKTYHVSTSATPSFAPTAAAAPAPAPAPAAAPAPVYASAPAPTYVAAPPAAAAPVAENPWDNAPAPVSAAGAPPAPPF